MWLTSLASLYRVLSKIIPAASYWCDLSWVSQHPPHLSEIFSSNWYFWSVLHINSIRRWRTFLFISWLQTRWAEGTILDGHHHVHSTVYSHSLNHYHWVNLDLIDKNNEKPSSGDHQIRIVVGSGSFSNRTLFDSRLASILSFFL